MTDPLTEATLARKRKDRAASCLHEILERTRTLRWMIFPDGEKVYLDLHEVQSMKEVRAMLTTLIERHEKDMKELNSADRLQHL